MNNTVYLLMKEAGDWDPIKTPLLASKDKEKLDKIAKEKNDEVESLKPNCPIVIFNRKFSGDGMEDLSNKEINDLEQEAWKQAQVYWGDHGVDYPTYSVYCVEEV